MSFKMKSKSKSAALIVIACTFAAVFLIAYCGDVLEKNSDEKDIIDAALKVKGIKVNGTFHEDSTNIKKEQSHLETKWVVSVKFKSLKDWE